MKKSEERISAKTFVLETKNDAFGAFSLDFQAGKVNPKLYVKGEEHSYVFGSGNWIFGKPKGKNSTCFILSKIAWSDWFPFNRCVVTDGRMSIQWNST